jgi:hypothetical protein
MKLAHTLNRTVLVSIPGFFGDDEPRTCTLVDIEPAGVWLAFDDLKARLEPAVDVPADLTSPVAGFFPFAHILFVVDPSQFAILARRGQRPAPRSAPPSPGYDETRDAAPREGRRKQKDTKSRR